VTDGSVPENSADFREWLSCESPAGETVLIDATFLNSNWTCIYGAGCPGVEEEERPELARGCCAFGAHFTDTSDQERTLAHSERLTDEQWQHRSTATTAGATDTDEDGAATTRLVDGACIFLNRPDFGTGAGCALHFAATAAGEPPHEWKPDVCWQLPLRVEENLDENGHMTRTVRAWLRRDWGEGGTELGWWCTERPGAYAGHEPAYATLATELTALVGEATYMRLVDRLEEALEP